RLARNPLDPQRLRRLGRRPPLPPAQARLRPRDGRAHHHRPPRHSLLGSLTVIVTVPVAVAVAVAGSGKMRRLVTAGILLSLLAPTARSDHPDVAAWVYRADTVALAHTPGGAPRPSPSIESG